MVGTSFYDIKEKGASERFSAVSKAITFNHERLHDALQTAIQRQLEEQLGIIFRDCVLILDELEHSVIKLKDAFASQASTFLKIKFQKEEMMQLMQAFRLGDAMGSGSIPADLSTLMEVLGGLGIAASHGDAAALLRELAAQESEYAAVGGGGVDTICFPNFASCMARLRD
ncbi:hypothetical protein EON62_04135 [archaeon]|nr:MAG: hypothetical protein EON62_04135 [archaeon]